MVDCTGRSGRVNFDETTVGVEKRLAFAPFWRETDPTISGRRMNWVSDMAMLPNRTRKVGRIGIAIIISICRDLFLPGNGLPSAHKSIYATVGFNQASESVVVACMIRHRLNAARDITNFACKKRS